MLRSPSALIASVLFLLALVSPSFAAGVLVPRNGGKPLDVKAQTVSAVVEDGLARTTLRQTFVNPGDASLEAIYLFPVPENAALVDVAMEVGGQRLEGLLVERQKARRVYDQIVRSNRDPALVEQVGRSRFRLSVFPVEPKKPTVVEISWIESVPLADGAYRYVYPLELAGTAATVTESFVLNVTFRSSAPIRALTSASPKADLVLVNEHEARMGYECRNARLDGDIIATATVRTPEPSLTVRSFRDADGAGYFAAVLTPPETEDAAVPRDITLVIDTSGSMEGTKLQQAVRSAATLFAGLRPTDRFNVIRFASTVEPFAARPVVADAEQIAKARAFVAAFAAQGSTALGDALVQALDAPVDPGRVHLIVLLTDGEPTVGMQEPDQLVAAAKKGGDEGRRLFTFGVGSDVKDTLLEALATAGRGTAEVVRSESQIEHRMTRFLRRTRSPVLANLTLSVDGLVPFAVHPNPLPDVYLGEQVVLTGRYRDGGRHTLRVEGRKGTAPFAVTAQADFRKDAGGERIVRDLHAHQRLTALQSQLRLRHGLSSEAFFASLDDGAYSTEGEVVREVIDLSIESGIQSAYTSFLVLLPEDRARLDPRDLAGLDAARKRARDQRTGARTPDGASPGSDPVVKDAKVADHDETDLETEDSLTGPRFNSDAPFEGPGTNGTIGIGGGAGGAFGGRRGGHRNLRVGGGGKKTETAYDLALDYLDRTQRDDGSWSGGSAVGDLAATGAAVLAYLGYGETHHSGVHKDNVKRGLKYLKAAQTPDGSFGPRTTPDERLANALASAALVEAYGMTGSRLFKGAAESALHHLLKELQVGTLAREDDPFTVLWQVLTLHGARLADLEVPKEGLDRLVDRHELAKRSSAEWAPLHVLVRCLRKASPDTAAALEARDALLSIRPVATDTATDTAPDTDLERLWLGSIAAFQDGGGAWTTWNAGLRPVLLDRQADATRGDERGSWTSAGPRGRAFGRAYATALGAICAGVDYRYGRVVGTK